MKTQFKKILVCTFLFAAFSLVGEMDYQDAVAQHKVNCDSASYVNDNYMESE